MVTCELINNYHVIFANNGKIYSLCNEFMGYRGSDNIAATPDLIAERDGSDRPLGPCQITLWKIASGTD